MDKIRIANCRGKKPVINDIAKMIKKLDELNIELNDCKAKELLNKTRDMLYEIVVDSGYFLSPTYTLLIKR
jgi:hypothetical protein